MWHENCLIVEKLNPFLILPNTRRTQNGCTLTQESATESGGGIFYWGPVKKKDER